MANVPESLMREQLVDRRRRLSDAMESAPEAGDFGRLLAEVDAALARLDDGTFGLCEVCHDPVEGARLLADPLVRFCLDHLNEAEQRALEQDLETAARVQRGLLPEPDLELSGWHISLHYEPAGPVSGDYCDVVRPTDGDGEVLFLFGDVSGKGVAAAMLMAHLHATFRSLLDARQPVELLVERANRVFRESTLSPYFATLVCGRTTDDGALEICNAGHWPPLLVAGERVSFVDPTGLPVGTFYSSRYSSRRLHLGPGDTLLLYTDGLIEARDAAGAEYGVDRLSRVAAGAAGRGPRAVLAACLEDLDRHLAGRAKGDDLTLLALRRTG